MASLGRIITKRRKAQNLTQQQLAEKANVNLRTIQRIEKDKNKPRQETLSLICEALEINPSELTLTSVRKIGTLEKTLHYFCILLTNLAIITLFGFLTLDSEANLNSQIGGLLLAYFIPSFLITRFDRMCTIERFFKFGSGLLIFIIIALIIAGLPRTFGSGLIICSAIYLLALYYH